MRAVADPSEFGYLREEWDGGKEMVCVLSSFKAE
jgi:hypothetical protein